MTTDPRGDESAARAPAGESEASGASSAEQLRAQLLSLRNEMCAQSRRGDASAR